MPEVEPMRDARPSDARPLDVTPLPISDGLQWSACVRDAAGAVVWQHDPTRVMRTASIGKILLLLETARQITDGTLDPDVLLSRADDSVRDSGVWQVMRTDLLPLHDVATLVGAVSDNVATNVLLRHIGLQSVDILRESCGLRDTRLLDQVRSRRGVADPPTLSTGRADELTRLVHRMANGVPAIRGSHHVVGWLSGNTDLSMVAGAFDLDPLAHRTADRPRVALWNKTGTDHGVRADVGHVSGGTTGTSTGIGSTAYSFALLANWDTGAGDCSSEVLAGMRAVGASLARSLG